MEAIATVAIQIKVIVQLKLSCDTAVQGVSIF